MERTLGTCYLCCCFFVPGACACRRALKNLDLSSSPPQSHCSLRLQYQHVLQRFSLSSDSSPQGHILKIHFLPPSKPVLRVHTHTWETKWNVGMVKKNLSWSSPIQAKVSSNMVKITAWVLAVDSWVPDLMNQTNRRWTISES